MPHGDCLCVPRQTSPNVYDVIPCGRSINHGQTGWKIAVFQDAFCRVTAVLCYEQGE